MYDTPPSRPGLTAHEPASFYSRPPFRQHSDNDQRITGHNSYETARNGHQVTVRNLENSPEIPLQNSAWQPGQRLPLSVCDNEQRPSVDNSMKHVYGMLQQIQGSVELNFKHVIQRLDSLEDRVTGMEERHHRLETASPSSASSVSPPEGGRNRRSPPELQVCCNVLYEVVIIPYSARDQEDTRCFS